MVLGGFRRKIKKFSSRVDFLSILSILAPVTFMGVVFAILALFFLFVWYGKNLPTPGRLTNRAVALSTKIYDRNGELLYDVYGDQNRTYVPLSEIPKNLRDATIAIEDKDFYKHQGFDPKGYLRIVKQVVFYHNLTGGSTLTQQLVKTVLLSSERTVTRKIKEFILSVQVEKKYSKDQILELYLNEAPYGGQAYGVEAASETYFGKRVKDLTLAEASLIAGLPQQPTSYSPFGAHPELARGRQGEVLRRMVEDGYISTSQASEAKKEILKYAAPGGKIKAPHFVMYVKQILAERYGEKVVEEGGFQVTTTVDLKIQEAAEKIVKEEVDKLKSAKVGNGAVVVLDPKTGAILAMVGSKDYFAKDYDGNVNVTTSLRQPGSSGKPIVYATALKRGYTASSMIMDVKTEFPTGEEAHPIYTPENYDGKFHGPQQLRFALGNSINVPAVKMVALLGVKDVMQTGFDMGISTWEPTAEHLKTVGLSLALGGREVTLLDMSSAFGVFANVGLRQDHFAILKVTDSKGKVLEEYKPLKGRQVLSPEISFIISHMLLDDNARQPIFGRNSLLVVPGKTVSVKTGTTDEKRDNWTIGFTPSVVVGVWVGNNDNSKMSPSVTSGVTGAAPIWNRIMKEILKNKPVEEPVKPDSVLSMEVDSLGGGLLMGDSSKRVEYFIKTTEPANLSPIYKILRISKHNGKIANDFEIKTGDFEEKSFIVFSENDPVSKDGKNRWQEGIDKWLSDNYKDDQKYHPPTEVSDYGKDSVSVRIKSPGDQTTVSDHDVQFDVEAISLKDIVKIDIIVDGSSVKSVSGSSFKERVNLNTGTHTIKVVANDSAGNSGGTEIKIGVGVPWDFVPPTPTSSSIATPTPASVTPTVPLVSPTP